MVAVAKEKMGEVGPFMAMVTMEGCTIALTILAKTALTGGLSPFVFVVYTNAVGSFLLLPFSFLYHRNQRIEQSLFSFPLLVRIFFLGLTGIAISQNLAFVGLSYSSPIVVCAMGLLFPSLSFLLSIFLSVIGTFITGMGYYTVMWGQIREEELGKVGDVEKGNDTTSDQIKAPLLHKEEEEAQV
ncbi:Drug/metabolite transporter [Corchorus olitorius]|uniref:Drug/metabolite transporter n=1 Tax=Corchorus olitorius TaxID=93759 RepID=A0A1R3J527_9ROSI|nr:Drug/metabolite transporter [Corchorus olitorius]